MSKPGLWQRINECCERFRNEMERGNNPDLRSFLQPWEEREAAEVYRQLLEVEVENRRERGEPVAIGEYASRFPEFLSISEQVVGSSCSNILDTMDAPPSGGSKHPTPHPQVAKYYGHYRVIETLGEGGMGAVYLAYDEQLERKVAVKVPFVDRGDAHAIVERFYREAIALAKIVHPNIVPIHEVNRDAQVPFLVMTFVQGKPLNESEVRPKEVIDVVKLVKKLARALHHAHQVGVVHRDLKPTNIVIDHLNEPVIIDFGLATVQRANSIELTTRGAILGTPSYMSPEQFDGRTDEIKDTSDIFTLGVIFYELLTGERPFQGENLYEIRDQVVKGEPVPPSTLREEIDTELDRIAAKAMAKKIDDRYSRMHLFAEDLERWLEQHGTVVSTPLPEMPEKPVRGQTMRPGTSSGTSRESGVAPTVARTKTMPLTGRSFDFEAASRKESPGEPPEYVQDKDKTVSFYPDDYGYQLIEQIGKGQYGEVWLAKAPGDVEVAVKKLRYPRGHRATEAEMRALELVKCLTHPLLLNVQAYWFVGDQLMSVTELADGTLEDLVKESGAAIPRDELLRYMHDVAEALDYLHEQNIYHRDIKPANILVQKGHVKVADFGIAVSGTVQEGEHTVACSTLGTPMYMAPELHEKQVGPSSDQYSLAVTYIELRLGGDPIDREDEFRLSDLPLEERDAVAKALATDPADRFSSCLEFIEAIRDAIRQKIKRAERRRLLIAGSLFAAIATPTGIGLRSWSRHRSAREAVPEGFVIPSDAVLVDAGGLPLYDRLVRPLANDNLHFLLVPESSNAPNVPSFYCMENLVTNNNFSSFVDEASPGSVSDNWREVLLGQTIDGDSRWTAEEHPNGPVLGITAHEAHQFATFIGADLPTTLQWYKAAGRWDHADADVGPHRTSADSSTLRIATLDYIEQQSLPEEPVDVGSLLDDISMYGCRDMAGNIREWTKTTTDPEVEVPFGDEVIHRVLIQVVGKDFDEDRPLTFDEMADDFPYSEDPSECRFGFRCVLSVF